MSLSLNEMIAQTTGNVVTVTDNSTRLKSLFKGYWKEYHFKPGMLVTWKPGLKNKKTPDYGEPLVLVELLDTPVLDEENGSGSPYFREPLDIICGEIQKSNFALYHYDSHRFMPYEAWLKHEERALEGEEG